MPGLTIPNPFSLGNAGGNPPTVGTPINLNDLATISRRQMFIDSSEDLDGVGVPQWTDIATDVPCKLLFRTSSFKESVRAGEESAVSQWQAYFPLGTDLLDIDRVTIDGFVHEVVATNVGATDAVLLLAELTRINQ